MHCLSLVWVATTAKADLLEPKLYFESNVIRVEVEADTYECELVSRLFDYGKE